MWPLACRAAVPGKPPSCLAFPMSRPKSELRKRRSADRLRDIYRATYDDGPDRLGPALLVQRENRLRTARPRSGRPTVGCCEVACTMLASLPSGLDSTCRASSVDQPSPRDVG